VARKLSAIADNRIVSVHFRAVKPEIFVYKIVADNGGAPCVWRGLLSLALCKPKIRKSAGVGALIFGFGGKEYGERLIYVAEVTEKPVTGEYYRQPRFAGRPDCIYEDVCGKSKRKDDARYHTGSDERPKDVGMRFENADVLLSRKFRYFGDRSTADYKADCAFNEVKALIEGLKRGHRRNHSVEVREQLLQLRKLLWRQYRKAKVGSPIESDFDGICNTDSPSASC
jgi:hypothetical protein